MWRKLLKYRDIAKIFHQIKVGDGNPTSFWFDSWSPLGCLFDLTGARGCIEMGISLTATVYSALHAGVITAGRFSIVLKLLWRSKGVLSQMRLITLSGRVLRIHISLFSLQKIHGIYSNMKDKQLNGARISGSNIILQRSLSSHGLLFIIVSQQETVCFSGIHELARPVSSVTSL